MTFVLTLAVLLGFAAFLAWLDRRPTVDARQIEKLSHLVAELAVLRDRLDHFLPADDPGSGSRTDSGVTTDNPTSRT